MVEIRDNINSPYMLVSDIYVGILLVGTFFVTCYWVPFRMKEFHIPPFLRKAQSNVFFDFMRIRIICFIFFITLSGSLP
jgi:hypothetical protein